MACWESLLPWPDYHLDGSRAGQNFPGEEITENLLKKARGAPRLFCLLSAVFQFAPDKSAFKIPGVERDQRIKIAFP